MQDQQVRQSCIAIAGQLFLLDSTPRGRQRSSNIASCSSSGGSSSGALPHSASTGVAWERVTPSTSSATGSSTGAEKKDVGADELRRACEAVVRDAMTLYRLCHRRGGSGGVEIVLSSAGGSGGGSSSSSGVGGVVEEAAYCVCAAIMQREERLWSSLTWRAQLLRLRRPTLCFAPPVMVPPVVLKDVVRFYGRSRHLMPGGSGAAMAASPAAALTAAGTATPTTAPPTTATVGSMSATKGLTAQQAEAVAAAFFFRTMTAAERQRRPEILEIRLAAPPAAPRGKGGAASSTEGRTIGFSTAAGTSAEAVKRSPTAPPPVAAALSALKGRGAATHGRKEGAAPQSRRPALLPRASSSLLLMDDWSGWGGGSEASRQRGAVTAATTAGLGWSRGNSSSRTSDTTAPGSRSRSRSGSSGTSVSCHERHAGKAQAPIAAGHRRDKHAKSAAAADAAVLERLYRLATAADAAPPDQEGEVEEGEGDGEQHVGGHTTAGVSSSSLFTSGKGLGLVSLAAMATQVQDTLHWGRMTALVRCPLLFRGLATPAWISPAAPAVVVAAGAAATSEALTAAAMTSMRNALGASYASTWMPAAAPVCTTASPLTDVDAFVSAYGSPGSFLCPARLRASSSSLLPRPPSLVTDGFLWTRLLICSAWLTVYADSLLDGSNEASSDDAEADDTPSASSTVSVVQPRVQPSAAVQAVVAYCVTIVREARSISAEMAGARDAAAAGLSSSAASPHHTATSTSGGVCCPVCDRLVKEQRPVLWWSTLREDRTQLRGQVQALLENSSATEAEAQIAAQVALDGVREGRGGRHYAAPLLRGSGAAGQRVTALQKHWGMYIMGISDPVINPAKKPAAVEGPPPKQGDHEEAAAQDSTDALWDALTQRVAATADLFAFVSTHREPDAQTATSRASAKGRADAAAAAVASKHRRGPTRAEKGGNGGRGRQTRKRRRRSDSSESSDDTEEDQAEEEEDGEERGHSSEAGNDHDDSHDGVPPLADTVAAVPFLGSRHAHEVAEEWERLLRRCGWVNAAPPRASANASARSPADVAVYTRWAASLAASAASPGPQQAAALRLRLSHYSLSELTRVLVLGRGGRRGRYTALLFGAEAALPTKPVSPPPPPHPLAHPKPATSTAVEPLPVCSARDAANDHPPAARRRAASMSLLGDDGDAEQPASLASQDLCSAVAACAGEGDARERRSSLSPPAITSADFLLPLSPPQSSSTTAVASTPHRRSSLLSIPLHASPRSLQTPAEKEAVPVQREGGSGLFATRGMSTTQRSPVPRPSQPPAFSQSVTRAAVTGCVATRSQLLAQRDALYALLDFCPRFPPLREEDAVLECGWCFSLFHQDCIAPVQRDVMGQVFLCHTCRLKWARPFVERQGEDGAVGGLVHQTQTH